MPCHVILNQAGTVLQRHNHRISGSNAQTNFVQRMVATAPGESYPLLYMLGMLFPRHFYAEASKSSGAILGSPPICCYTTQKNPYGFASNLDHSRLHLTNAGSSTSTDAHLTYFNYDVQCNSAMSNIDSRLATRHGFAVDEMSPYGIRLRNKGESDLSEGVDSHQAALNLAGTKPYMDIHLFLTFTCNQAEHPGIKHLHEWKSSRSWTRKIPGYDNMTLKEQREYIRAFEQAYGTIVSRSWFIVRKRWLEYITHSTSSAIGKPFHVFWRDEYQDKCGNLPHIHGLAALYKEDMENEKFSAAIYDLQRCSVLDLCSASEAEKMIGNGILKDYDDWKKMNEQAHRHLSHICGVRCKVRVGAGEGEENFRCKKPNTVYESVDCAVHELQNLKYVYSDEFIELMDKLDLYNEPEVGVFQGDFKLPLLNPRRHVGKVHHGATDNMSPVCNEWFAALRSMMNYQVMHGTNGVARYVVKYVVKLDDGNRCTVWADAHSGATMRVENQFLHNTKIVRSKIYEEKAHERSRGGKHPSGRAIAFVECVQHILCISEVMTTLKFIEISTKPLEERGTTKVRLTQKGTLDRPDYKQKASDVHSFASPMESIRKNEMNVSESRKIKANQMLLYRGTAVKAGSYDKVTLFGLRPPELMQLFRKVGGYYRWFVFEKESSLKAIREQVTNTVCDCPWYDSLGRRVRLRYHALSEVLDHIKPIKDSALCEDSQILRNVLVDMIEGHIGLGGVVSAVFVANIDDIRDLPIPVFSSVRPDTPIPFLLHMMLMCGSFDTELDLRECTTMRESLSIAGLIGTDMGEGMRLMYVENLLRVTMEYIVPPQPISMRKMEDFILKARDLFEGVILRDEIPSKDMPSCILTQLYMSKEKELIEVWPEIKKDHVEAIYQEIDKESMPDIPTKNGVLKCSRDAPAKWVTNPIAAFVRHKEQSEESFAEQKLAVDIAVRSLVKYKQEFGKGACTYTKGEIITGVPGAGKSHVVSYITLVAMSYGLRVMTTALMGVRANAFGGIHFHRLLCLPLRGNISPYRLAELAITKLNLRCNMKMLHILLTVDILVIDEAGMFSAEQLSILNLILRKLRHVNSPYGGVLIFGTMDHAQFSAIDGLPFLLSSSLLTDFSLVGLQKSVRASSDPKLQELQDITRKNPKFLTKNHETEYAKFKRLCLDILTWIPSWDDERIDHTVQRMYAKCKPAQEACLQFVESLKKEFDAIGTEYVESVSVDRCRLVKTVQDYKQVKESDNTITKEMDRKFREPRSLLFYKGATFESTLNFKSAKKGKAYSQSQLLLMVDIPTTEQIRSKGSITLYKSKPGVNYIDLADGVPGKDTLASLGWKEVSVKCTPENRSITVKSYQCTRMQYSLKHVGSSTITKQTGNTIHGKCAIEVSRGCQPWDKPGVVVMLSRATVGRNIMIVTEDKEYAIEVMWNAITKGNQWTDHIEHLLSRLCINPGTMLENNVDSSIDQGETYPFQTCEIPPPSGNTGFVYMLISVPDPSRTYIGQAQDVELRVNQHNIGQGSDGTRDIRLRPWSLAGYIGGMGHLTCQEREYLEARWKQYIQNASCRSNCGVMGMLDQGQRVTEAHNEAESIPGRNLLFVKTLKRQTVYEIDEKVRGILPAINSGNVGGLVREDMNQSEQCYIGTTNHVGHLV